MTRQRRKLSVFSDEEPSEEFVKALQDWGLLGGSIGTCGHCGRVSFTLQNPGQQEMAGLQTLQRKALNNPDKYVERSSESIRIVMLAYKETVIGCPCNAITFYEQLFFNHRELIAEYYKLFSTNLSKAATKEARLSASVLASV